jgi:Z1 domain
MTFTAEMLAAAVTNMLPLDPAPSEAAIDAALEGIVRGFRADEALAQEARRLLHARFAVRMDVGQTLVSEEVHEPWLARRRATIDPFYWSRYREALLREGWGPLVTSTLDQATNQFVDLMGDPERTTAWKRRGLVGGDVQSGKTATYAALICKAADAGYRMVILLTGMLENVRRQTQERLDAAFVGLDSRDFLTMGQLGRKKHIGVGLINPRRDGIVFTSRDYDFRRTTASALNISLASVNEPVLVVTKKNKAVLQRLAAWLRAFNQDREGRIDLPMLLVDDEADNASINTRLNPAETTAINAAIRDLLSLFRRSSYVGFTATPFANIFIDPASTDDMLGDDLFPSDFIHVLEAPTNYVGMNRLFGPTDPDDLDDDRAGSPLRTIEDEHLWLPPDHKNFADVNDLSESLLKALRSFLLATAIRDLRAARGVDGRGGGIHRSMLVNVSRFTAVQNTVAGHIHNALEAIRTGLRLYGNLSPSDAARSNVEIAALADVFGEEFGDCGMGWPEVLAALHPAVAPVIVQPVNQSTGAASLDYSKDPAGLRVIAVGGNSLSRGLTLEGLSTSYFLRNARTYDTLLQMGRWLGYRDGYGDLCRVWLTSEAEGWYRHVTEATAELKRDFGRMQRRQATPKEFGLRVRTHPDTLLITARNKMATGMDVTDDTRDISLIGRMVESARLYRDARRNQHNREHVEKFCEQLVAGHGLPVESPHSGAVLWKNVPSDLLAPFLDGFLVHPLNHDFQGDSIAEFLRNLPAEGDLDVLKQWTVALVTVGRGERVSLVALPGVEITATKRRVAEKEATGSLLISGKSARVGSPRDVRHGLSLVEVQQVRDESGADASADTFRLAMPAPLLVIYLIQGVVREDPKDRSKDRPYRDGMILPALAAHFPGVSDPDAPRRLVRYRLNRIAQDELLGTDRDDDDDADADPDD